MAIKKLFAVVIALFIVLSATSCKDNSAGEQTISYQTKSGLSTVDPQLAQTEAEIITVANCFEGLFCLGSNGEAVKGACEDYRVSQNGLDYTFTLRNNMLWSDEETKVTASDFVFGIIRALSPETESPFAKDLFCIKNAQQYNSGKCDKSSVGITALSELELKISLKYKVNEFESILCSCAAMPCNEAFFVSTNGKYGLADKKIITNGAFYLKSWDDENGLVKMHRFSEYNGENPAIPYAVSLGYSREDEAISENLKNKDIDSAIIDAQNISDYEKTGFTAYKFYNKNYVLYISDNIADSENKANMKKCLISDINKDIIDINLPDYYEFSETVAAPGTIEKNTLRSSFPKKTVMPAKNIDFSVSFANEHSDLISSLAGETLYYPEGNEDIKNIANLIAQAWQSELLFMINTEEYSESDLESLSQSDEFNIAIIPVESSDNSVKNALRSIGFVNENIINKLDKINSNDNEKYFNQLSDVEQSLIDSHTVYPLFATPKVYCVDSTVSNTVFSPAGDYIIFRNCVKIER